VNRPGILGELDAADGAICTVAELLAKLGHRQESEAVIALRFVDSMPAHTCPSYPTHVGQQSDGAGGVLQLVNCGICGSTKAVLP